MGRLDTGRWGSTDPEQMNTLAKSLHGSAARFTRIDRYAQKKYQPDLGSSGSSGSGPENLLYDALKRQSQLTVSSRQFGQSAVFIPATIPGCLCTPHRSTGRRP